MAYRHLTPEERHYIEKRYGSTTGSTKGIPNRVGIDGRPAVANQRGRLGDWEADTMTGKGHRASGCTGDIGRMQTQTAPRLTRGKQDGRSGDWQHHRLAGWLQRLGA